ncbi:MAG TPA: hypothetical protein VGF08_10615 [Terriglobales bacterium]|jgi:hypothetical protein
MSQGREYRLELRQPALRAFALGLFAALALSPALGQRSSRATVTFTFDFPGSTPDHYVSTVDSSGHATYVSGIRKSLPQAIAKPADSDDIDQNDAASTTASDEPFEYSFAVSETTRARIFDLAARANYFEGDLEYKKSKVASTGAKTFAYKDDSRDTHSTFNYTTNQPAQQLLSLFQNLSATLEFGRRLLYLQRYQKLALDQELKRMEEMDKSSSLVELQAVAPILKKVLADPAVINVSRARAERLLAKADATR